MSNEDALTAAARTALHELRAIERTLDGVLNDTSNRYTHLKGRLKDVYERVHGLADLLDQELDRAQPSHPFLRKLLPAAWVVLGAMNPLGDNVAERIDLIDIGEDAVDEIVEHIEGFGAAMESFEMAWGDSTLTVSRAEHSQTVSDQLTISDTLRSRPTPVEGMGTVFGADAAPDDAASSQPPED